MKTRSSKSRKIDIFSKRVNPCFWSKNGHFSNFPFFKGLLGRKMSFTMLENEKTPFQAIKTKMFKKSKMAFFSKGLTHGLCQKMAIFPTFFLQVIQATKISFTIFQNEKTPFQAIETRISKSLKIDIFSNGLTHGFSAKMEIFPIFFFRQYRPAK